MKAIDSPVPTIEMPFAYDDVLRNYDYYKTGITAEMTVPGVNGGTRFDRHMMNGMGYLSSLGTFLWQCGYPFSREDMEKVSAAIGGYPKGAIVYVIHDDGYLVEYVSKVDDNQNPIPDIDNGVPVEDDNWKPLYETVSLATVPNFTSITAEASASFSIEENDDETSFHLDMEVDKPSMVVATCAITDWPKIAKIQTVLGVPRIAVSVKYGDNAQPIELGQMSVTAGGTAMQSFPLEGGTITIGSSNYNFSVYGEITVDMKAYALGAS